MKFATRGLARCLVAAALLTLAGTASALEYRYVKIEGPVPASPDGWTEALDVNAKGQVVGNFSGGLRDQKGYIYDQGSYTLLTGPTGAVSVQAWSISDDGTVVGTYLASNGQRNSFIYGNGLYQTFEAPGFLSASLRGISPNGRYLAGESSGTAFVYDRATSTLVQAPTDRDGVLGVQGINDSGVLVGYGFGETGVAGASFTFDAVNGVHTVYGATPRIVFKDINSRGEILARGSAPGSPSDNLLGLPGQFQPLDVRPAMLFGTAGMNDDGWLVGVYTPDLNTMRVEGFLAIPVPEPTTWGLMLGGLAVIGWRARRRG